jgi:hypothetical protein
MSVIEIARLGKGIQSNWWSDRGKKTTLGDTDILVKVVFSCATGRFVKTLKVDLTLTWKTF